MPAIGIDIPCYKLSALHDASPMTEHRCFCRRSEWCLTSDSARLSLSLSRQGPTALHSASTAVARGLHQTGKCAPATAQSASKFVHCSRMKSWVCTEWIHLVLGDTGHADRTRRINCSAFHQSTAVARGLHWTGKYAPAACQLDYL